MAPHSSTLAWKILWMEEPGGLQSMGSQSRTRLSNFTFTFHFHALEKEMATQQQQQQLNNSNITVSSLVIFIEIKLLLIRNKLKIHNALQSGGQVFLNTVLYREMLLNR